MPAEAGPDPDVEGGLEQSFDRGVFKAGLAGATSRPRGGGGGAGLKEAELDLRLSIPLYSRLHIDRSGPSGWFWLANLSARGYVPNATLTGESERFYRFGAGMSLSYLTSSLNLYSLAAGARIAESEQTLGEPRFQPVVTGLGTYRFNDRVTLLYGVAFAYQFGAGRVLPLLGLNWKISDSWRFSTLLPAFLYFEHSFDEEWHLTFGLALSGDSFGYQRDLAPGVTDHPTARVVRLRALGRVSYGLHRQTQLHLEAGFQGLSADPSRQKGDEKKYTGVYAGIGIEVPYGQ